MPGAWTPYDGPAGTGGRHLPAPDRTCWCGGTVRLVKQRIDPVGYRCRTVCTADAWHDPADPDSVACVPCNGRGITQDDDHVRAVCDACGGAGRVG